MGYKLFDITADYRPLGDNQACHYYVIASTKKWAREIFKNKIPWLKIYNVEICDDDKARDIIKHPMNHIILT